MPCFYTPHLVPGMKSLTIEGEEFHHLVHVFRKRAGEQMLLTNGRGLIASASIDSIEKKSLTVKTISVNQRVKSKPYLAIGFSLLRNKNDQLIIEKLTELGVSVFYPFISERSVRTAGENTNEKFIKTAIAAMKQCDNPFLPQIKEVLSLEKTISEMQVEGYTILAALERDVNKLISDCLSKPYRDKIALLFGPEGGFTDQEILFIEDKDIKCFTIGNHILRSETAAIAGLSQLILTILKTQPDYF